MLETSWEGVLKTALLGTGRDSSAPQLDGSLGAFGAAETPEKTLLNAATALSVCYRAGRLPSHNPAPTIEICAPETQPYFSPRATSLLDAVLSGHRELLPQTLVLAAQSGHIAPPSLLIPLLEQGRASKELRVHLAPILGERGRWLAQLNPDWKNVAAPLDEDLEKTWQDGENAARCEALRLQREREPNIAREWLEVAFKSEPARQRAEFLSLLEIGLSNADEPFLESALDDKSKEVRALAVALLEKLPDSRLVERAKTELAAMLQWNGKEIEVILPKNWNPAWERDGLTEKPANYYAGGKRLGAKASWLHQFAQRVPPSHWETSWKTTPAKIVAAAPKEWRDLLFHAWWDAAKTSNESAWPMAILEQVGMNQFGFNQFGFNGLAPETADMLLLELWRIKDSVKTAFFQIYQLMSGHPGPFSRELSQEFLEALQKVLLDLCNEKKATSQSQQVTYALRYSLASFADKFSLELAADAARGWPDNHENWETWRPTVEKFLTRLQLRADLHNEFSKVKS